MTKFTDLGLSAPILKAVAAEGYDTPTPIQARAIPTLLAGRDFLGIAQTGTGKTAAFSLPLLHRLSEGKRAGRGCIRSIVLAPTRELAQQIGDSVRAYGRGLGLRHAVVVGGVSMGPQTKALAGGLDILIATPGRLKDHMTRMRLTLDTVEVFILDEADRMLDMGFAPEVKRLAARLPADRQTVLFSATMPKQIEALVAELLTDPERVTVAPQSTTAERIEQKVLFVPRPKKNALLTELMADSAIARVLVFTRTKHGADKVVRHLESYGVACAAIHGNKSQGQRQKALAGFKAGRLRALVATDIAARGIDVDGVTHVINYDLPDDPENYVHRIGRTARGGAEGIALSFCDADQRELLPVIEKIIRQPVDIHLDHPFHCDVIAAEPARGGGRGRPGGPKGGPRNGKRGGFQGQNKGKGGKPGGFANKKSGAPKRGRRQGHAPKAHAA